MKGYMRNFVAVSGAFLMSTSAFGAVVTIKAKGKIDEIVSLLNGSAVPVPETTIQIGDTFSLTATFDTGTATLDAFWAANPNINMYYLPGTTAKVTVGSYTDDFSAPFWVQHTLTLMNDVADFPLSDGEHYELSRFGSLQPLIPVAMGGEDDYLGQGVYLHAYDPTATARDNDLISELRPLSLFSDQRFFLLFSSQKTLRYVHFGGLVSESSLTIQDGVPEPAGWAMMIAGFSLAGAAMRYRRVAMSGA